MQWGRHRGAGLGGAHDEREQTLNQILVEMDGFDTDTNIIIIAATNRPDILDPALLRPGRFDRRVTMDQPDVKGRRAILDVHVRGKPLSADVDLDVIAKQTPGFAGADIENLVNEAAILAARRNRRSIGTPELQEAIERVIAGPPILKSINESEYCGNGNNPIDIKINNNLIDVGSISFVNNNNISSSKSVIQNTMNKKIMDIKFYDLIADAKIE